MWNLATAKRQYNDDKNPHQGENEAHRLNIESAGDFFAKVFHVGLPVLEIRWCSTDLCVEQVKVLYRRRPLEAD